MTTRNILFPDGRPMTDKPDALPGPSPDAPPKRPFAAVIEQALRRRPVGRASSRAGSSGDSPHQPGSARSARSSPHQRDDATSSARAKAVRLPKAETSKPAASDAPPASVDPKGKTWRPEEDAGIVPSAGATEDDAFASLEDAAPVQDRPDESGLPDGVPQNIVLFPVPSVIIPFPLAEAKAMRGSARAVESTLLGEAASEASKGAEENAKSDSLSLSPFPPFSPAPLPGEEDAVSTEGMDVSKLGLTLVDEPGPNVLPVEFAKSSTEESAARNEPAIISVSFRPSQSGHSVAKEEPQTAQTQLPGEQGATEESAPIAGSTPPAVETPPQRLTSAKAAVRAGLPGLQPHGAGTAEATGISAARQERRMESLTNSEAAARQAISALTGRQSGALEESPVDAAEPSRDDGNALDFSARNLSATEWQTGRPVSSSDRPSSDSLIARTADTTATVERISKLVLGEAALVKQYSSDSMAVVLRPDAETELFVHLTQRNGQIEATIRCERGDVQHLGALWGQLQESLAQQKVRLAPLQESPSNHSNFNQPAGSDTNGSGHGSPRHSQREGPPPPEKQSMDEWPAPASSSTDPAHVRGRGGSRHRRVTTSRPGWETWA